MVDKSDEETVDEQTSAASLAWVLDTCAEAVVELTDAEDFADACIAAGPAHQTPQYSRRAPGPTEAEAPRGVLKRLMRKVSKLVTPAALESLPRLVAALCGSEYLSEVMEAVQEAYYQRHPKPSDPEEEEYWRFEIPHTIS